MNILFITASRLGDAILSTGLLDHIVRTYPGARITVVCGALPASLFDGVPGLQEIIILKKRSWNRHWMALWRRVAGTRWDMVIDLRNSAVSRLIPARARFIYGSHIDSGLHKVEQMAAVMRLDEVPAPRLWITPAQEKSAAALVPDGPPVLAVGPTANWRAKTWPAERFIEVVAQMTGASGVMPGARVAVFAAPGEEDDARKVLAAVPSVRQIDMIARADPGVAAAALARCAFYVGNDSGLMHCAAAARVPTVGLFGPSYPHLYRPWGDRCAYVRTPETFDQLTDYAGYDPKTAPCLMGGVSVENVLTKISELCKNLDHHERSDRYKASSAFGCY